MPTEAMIALGTFVALVMMWVILPSVLKNKQKQAEEE